MMSGCASGGYSWRALRTTATPLPSASSMSTTRTSNTSSLRREIASDWVAACAATETLPGSDKRATKRRLKTSESSISRMRRSTGAVPWIGARVSWGLTTSLHKLVLDRVVGHVGIAFHAHLFQDARAISTDRLHAQEERLADFSDALAFGKLAEDLEFTFGEHRMRRLVPGGTLHPVDQHFGELGAHIATPAHRGADRAAQLIRRRSLTDKAARASAQHVEAILLLRKSRQHERCDALVVRLDSPEDIEARHVGQR